MHREATRSMPPGACPRSRRHDRRPRPTPNIRRSVRKRNLPDIVLGTFPPMTTAAMHFRTRVPARSLPRRYGPMHFSSGSAARHRCLPLLAPRLARSLVRQALPARRPRPLRATLAPRISHRPRRDDASASPNARVSTWRGSPREAAHATDLGRLATDARPRDRRALQLACAREQRDLQRPAVRRKAARREAAHLFDEERPQRLARVAARLHCAHW